MVVNDAAALVLLVFENGFDYRIKGMNFEALINEFIRLAEENEGWEYFDDYETF